MTLYVFDTNIVSLILRRDSVVLNKFQAILQPDTLILGCPIVWYEIRRGLITVNATAKLRRFEMLFANFEWQDLSRLDWSEAARLWAIRRLNGSPIEDADLIIGVFAKNRLATLITANDKDFADLGVTIENWTL